MNIKETILLSAIALFVLSLSGCSKSKDDTVIFNLCDSRFIAQSDECYFLTDLSGITAISKSNGNEFRLIRDPFCANNTMNCGIMFCENAVYYSNDLSEAAINKISLDSFSKETVYSEAEVENGFLGFALRNSVMDFGKSIYAAFTDGENYFVVPYGQSAVYMINNHFSKVIISDEIYDNQLCFDGNNIFYINDRLWLIRYSIDDKERDIISKNFTRAIYYDGKQILYSNNDGIFSLDTENFTSEKLSNAVAEKISSDGKNIVYDSGGKLYLLSEETIKIYDESYLNFAVLSGVDKVIVQYFENSESFRGYKLKIINVSDLSATFSIHIQS